ncbi:MAG: hypothetical protein H6673_15730 [Anaerolineales bacterium]|nr:hypothetical protein [Anaerolineales bacterium]
MHLINITFILANPYWRRWPFRGRRTKEEIYAIAKALPIHSYQPSDPNLAPNSHMDGTSFFVDTDIQKDARITIQISHKEGSYVKWNVLQKHWEGLIKDIGSALHAKGVKSAVKMEIQNQYSQSIGVRGYVPSFMLTLGDALSTHVGLLAASTCAVGVFLFLGNGLKLSNDIALAIWPGGLTASLTTVLVAVKHARSLFKVRYEVDI